MIWSSKVRDLKAPFMLLIKIDNSMQQVRSEHCIAHWLRVWCMIDETIRCEVFSTNTLPKCLISCRGEQTFRVLTSFVKRIL